MSKPAINVIVAAVLLSLVGCGRQSELQKFIVSGKISYAGAPIKNGQIYFLPSERGRRVQFRARRLRNGASITVAVLISPLGNSEQETTEETERKSLCCLCYLLFIHHLKA